MNCLVDPRSYRSAEIKAVDVPIGYVGVPYQAELRGSVDDEPNDDAFSYDFRFEGGVLPPGTSLSQHGRSGYIAGTPGLAGLFTSTIGVEIEPSLDELCNVHGDPNHAQTALTIEIHSADAP